MKINLPNQITIARLFISIAFFACLAQYDVKAGAAEKWLLDWSAILFLIAAVSDFIDGYLARKQNQVTSFGRILDPFVDKILVMGAYIFLAGDGFMTAHGENTSHVASWMVVVILGRELLVTSLRGITEASGESFGANLYGKIKMVLQSTTVVWILLTLAHPVGLEAFAEFRIPLVYITVIVTFFSTIPYLFMARGVLRQVSVSA